jgi:cobaltochelatase CobN
VSTSNEQENPDGCPSVKPAEVPGVFTEIVCEDGKKRTLRVVEGHLWVCKGCCCGNTEAGIPAVPVERFKQEWKKRRIRNRIHLTISGCLGPCGAANVILLNYKGSMVWLRSINSDADVDAIYDYIEGLLEKGAFELPADGLREKLFQRYTTDAASELSGLDEKSEGQGVELRSLSACCPQEA